jgi:hypothetical protein
LWRKYKYDVRERYEEHGPARAVGLPCNTRIRRKHRIACLASMVKRV